MQTIKEKLCYNNNEDSSHNTLSKAKIIDLNYVIEKNTSMDIENEKDTFHRRNNTLSLHSQNSFLKEIKSSSSRQEVLKI